MDSDRRRTVRNVGILLVLALAVWRLPEGALAGRTISNLLSIILLAGLSFFAYRMYMQNRTTLLDLPERQRVVLYGSVGLMIITLVATSRMWNSGGPLVLLWF